MDTGIRVCKSLAISLYHNEPIAQPQQLSSPVLSLRHCH